MRLRELGFPIAYSDNDCLMGDSGNRRFWRWDNLILSPIQEGSIDDFTFYDKKGRIFEIEQIYVFKRQWWWWVNRLDNLIIFGLKNKIELVNIDMELKQIGTITPTDMHAKFLQLLADNPSWWQGWSWENIIKSFDVPMEYSAILAEVHYFIPRKVRKLKGHSSKVIDLRKS